MATYNALPFELHDTILSALCQYGTYRDVLAYGTTSKYHYELLKQNSDYHKLKAHSLYLRIKTYNGTYNWPRPIPNDNQISAIIPSWPFDFINGLWMENYCGQLIKAEFLGNQFCIERLDNPIMVTGGWIPFGFSRHHGFYGFPIRSLPYIQLQVALTFDNPQTDTFKLYGYGQKLLSRDAHWKLFKPYELSYPIVSDVFSRVESLDSPALQRVKPVKEIKMAISGGAFSLLT